MKSISEEQVHEEPQSIKDVSDIIGGYGPWQRAIFLIIIFFGFPSAWHNLSITFLAPDISHWCSPPDSLLNYTIDSWKDFAIPKEEDMDGKSYSSCEMYKINSNLSSLTVDRNQTVPCKTWQYDHSFYYSTVIEKWNLVCGRSWLKSMSQSVYMAGYLTGCLLLGQLSDSFGRRPIMLLGLVILLISGIVCAFAPYFWLFTVTRFLTAVGRCGMFVTGFVLLLEVVGPEWRPVLGVAREIGWAAGFITLPGLAWLLRDWFYLQLTISLLVVLYFVTYWIIPESPRWLLTHDRDEEAKIILTKASRKNGFHKPIEESVNKLKDFITKDLVESKAKQKATLLDLFKTPNMRKKTINVCFNWFVNSFVFYGLSLNTEDLGGNLYINFSIAGAVEFPAYLCTIVAIKRLGRRIPLMSTMVAGGIACALTTLFPEHLWARVTLTMFGKFCITCSYVIIYVFSAEIYPTVVRNVGVGCSSTCARIGAIVAPFMKEVGAVSHPSVPFGIFGGFSVAAGLLCLLLPETNEKTLPDTLQQGEEFEK
ncbi:organic cation transporter protein-like [Tachypleus tridentatus]|uniref:organic cation transporter protein-like n=1 Tax=Tachypleus tridentatus TaxID=6853 RepID=UPI003FD5DFA8